MSIHYRPPLIEQPTILDHIPIHFKYAYSKPPFKNHIQYLPHYKFLYLIQGQLILNTEHGSQHLSAQHTVLIPPYLKHNIKILPNTFCEYLFIEIENYRQSFPDNKQANTTTVFYDQENRLAPTVQQIITELTHSHHSKQSSLQLFVNVLTGHLTDLATAVDSSRTGVLQPAIQVCKSFIDHYFPEDISLCLLSEKSQLSVCHLSRQFKQQVGLTPIQYLTQVRINHAKRFLSDTRLSVNQISESCGFISPTYFSQVFKVHTDFTPTQYRRNSQQTIENL